MLDYLLVGALELLAEPHNVQDGKVSLDLKQSWDLAMMLAKRFV